nr:MAG TPA: hypothetical protein [Caudoviricetes sp.]
MIFMKYIASTVLVAQFILVYIIGHNFFRRGRGIMFFLVLKNVLKCTK